ncbi:MAG: GrpB family protein [Actinomycetota bacterium]|nr:GrpB family protein [Actinomycetota bacterium]
MSDDGILIGGREKRPIVLEDWDQRWVERFEQERERIVRALGEVVRRIEHVGSTSVTGLAAKPIVDIQLSVADVEDEAFYVPPMEAAGYVLRVREPGHRMFRTPDIGVQIHFCTSGSDWERRHLLFRDWLRRSSEDRVRYEASKRELARREWDDVNDYADAKSTVIKKISERAESWAAATGWSL